MSRTRAEVLARFRQRRVEEAHWRARVLEFGSLEALANMRLAQARVNELAWMLEAFENESDDDDET